MKALDKFFFESRPTEGIALFRIIFGLIVLFSFLIDLGNIYDFYGPHALVSLNTVKNEFQRPHINLFHLLGHNYSSLYLLVALYIVSTITMVLGLYTRTSIFLVLICMTSFHQRNIWLLSSMEVLMRTITILLLCSPCGHSLSFDSWLGRKFGAFHRPRKWAPWALRLIQIQISVIYLWTVWHKLTGTDWLDGSALYYATRMEDMTNFSLSSLMNSILFLKIMTWGTLVVELVLGIFVWISKTRKPTIILGIIFHLGIEFFMTIPFFEILMMSLLTLYFTPEELRGFVYNYREKIKAVLPSLSHLSGEENESI